MARAVAGLLAWLFIASGALMAVSSVAHADWLYRAAIATLVIAVFATWALVFTVMVGVTLNVVISPIRHLFTRR